MNKKPFLNGDANGIDDEGIKLKSVVFDPIDEGIFVRFRDNMVGYVGLKSLMRKQDISLVIPASVFLRSNGISVVFPMLDGGEWDVDYLAIRALFDAQVGQRLRDLEIRSASQLGERIKSVRKKRGWTQMELGVKTGLDQAAVSRLERGVHYPRIETLERTAAIFSIPVTELIFGE
ncbi:MAG: helix-turn-helix transcriptional regulator [Bacteroidetes bacterium]|nr:helix-turn-helix transcriptional regulator [Bacteroidota bacterium]